MSAAWRMGRMALFAMAIACIAMNWNSVRGNLRSLWVPPNKATDAQITYHGAGQYVDGAMELLGKHVDESADVFILVDDKERITPTERSIIIGADWVIAPGIARYGSIEALGDADAMIADEHEGGLIGPDFASANVGDGVYTKIDSAGGKSLWLKKEYVKAGSVAKIPAASRELVGVTVVSVFFLCCLFAFGSSGVAVGASIFAACIGILSLGLGSVPCLPCLVILIGCAWAMSRINGNFCMTYPKTDAGIMAAIAVVLVSYALLIIGATLPHTLFPPNGLGVTGGRAKFFFSDSTAFLDIVTNQFAQVFQPMYPPGMALITTGCYGIAGGCGDWLAQFLGGVLMWCLVFMVSRRCKSACLVFLVFAFFFTTSWLQCGTLLYSEPLMAICVLAALERLDDGKDGHLTWIILGMAGFYKFEGMVFYLLLWLSHIFAKRNLRKTDFSHLIAGAAFPLIWPMSLWICGGRQVGFTGSMGFSWNQFGVAVARILHYVYAEPWRTGFVFVLAAIVASVLAARCMTVRKACPRMLDVAVIQIWRVLIFSHVSIIGIAVIYAFCDPGDYLWRIRSSLPRLVMVPTVVLLHELVGLRLASLPTKQSRV